MDSLPVAAEESIRQARSRFFAGNSLSGETVSRTVLSSWQRSLNHGVAVSQDPADLPVLSAGQLAEAQEEGSDLSHFSRPIMEHLFGQIRQTSSMVILTDAAGTILHSIGRSRFCRQGTKSIAAAWRGLDGTGARDQRDRYLPGRAGAGRDSSRRTFHDNQSFSDLLGYAPVRSARAGTRRPGCFRRRICFSTAHYGVGPHLCPADREHYVFKGF